MEIGFKTRVKEVLTFSLARHVKYYIRCAQFDTCHTNTR
jgi:hypothetical protein